MQAQPRANINMENVISSFIMHLLIVSVQAGSTHVQVCHQNDINDMQCLG